MSPVEPKDIEAGLRDRLFSPSFDIDQKKTRIEVGREGIELQRFIVFDGPVHKPMQMGDL